MYYNRLNKTKKIRSARENTVQRKQPQTTFHNGNTLRDGKTYIPKQIEEAHIEKNCPRNRLGKLKGKILGHRLGVNAMYLGKGQGSKIRKGIVQKYTASVQQIGRTLRDKGEKEWREVGARAS